MSGAVVSADRNDPSFTAVNRRLEETRTSVYVYARGNYHASVAMSYRNKALGTIVVLFSVVTGSTLLGTLSGDRAIWATVLVATISLVSALASGMQTFLKYAEDAGAYQTKSARYAAIKRELDGMRTEYDAGWLQPNEVNKMISVLVSRREVLDGEAPTLADRFYDKGKLDVTQDKQSITAPARPIGKFPSETTDS